MPALFPGIPQVTARTTMTTIVKSSGTNSSSTWIRLRRISRGVN
jgi:hypothetical protein